EDDSVFYIRLIFLWVKAILVENFLQSCHILFHSSESNTAFHHSKIPVVTPEQDGSQQSRNLFCTFCSHIRISIAIPPRPEAQLNDLFFRFTNRTIGIKVIIHHTLYIRNNRVKHMLQKPG